MKLGARYGAIREAIENRFFNDRVTKRAEQEIETSLYDRTVYEEGPVFKHALR